MILFFKKYIKVSKASVKLLELYAILMVLAAIENDCNKMIFLKTFGLDLFFIYYQVHYQFACIVI